jgi:transposase
VPMLAKHYVGLDWGGVGHAVCVIDAQGAVIDRFEVGHHRAGLDELLHRLRRHGAPADLPIAIERPSGLVVDLLVAAGHPLVPIHPNVVKACRPRYRAANAKSDPGDAFMLADVLRTDGHRFRPLQPPGDAVMALRALVRGRDDLVAQKVALTNQLRSLLEGFWPGAAAIFADLASPIALAFVSRYPTPDSAARLGAKRMAKFLATHGYSGRRSPDELLARLHAAPDGRAGSAEADAKGELVRILAAQLDGLVVAITRLNGRIAHEVQELPEGRIVMSFPRAGQICAAQITAELGDVRDRFPTEAQLAAEAGVAPVTKASGKSRGVVSRFACNKRLRAAITCFADNSRHASPWAADVYTRARARGCRHPHAIRILARAWLRVLWRAWHNHQTYDPAQHNAVRKFAA